VRAKNIRAGVLLVIAVLLSVAVTMGVLAALRNPTDGATRAYHAGFSDASGLRSGSDVRLRGVLVGKVTDVSVQRHGGGNQAEVGFTVKREFRVTSETKLAIKYRNLTGERFIDIQPGTLGTGYPVTEVPTANTVPSFDITTLFNGLAPVLQTLNPGDVNQLTRNLIGLLQGDGVGSQEMFASIEKITANLKDRQQVLQVLFDNIGSVARTMNNYSPQVVEFIMNFDLLLTKTLQNLSEFRRTAQYGPGFVGATNRILKALGMSKDLDIDKLLNTALKDPWAAAEALRQLPGIFTGISALLGPFPAECSKGPAKLPGSVTVLVGGVNVQVCAR
jgi:phospholipid/cholesterol/gamma-HCH transport system substrate-binding protein